MSAFAFIPQSPEEGRAILEEMMLMFSVTPQDLIDCAYIDLLPE